jgi:hypothetical protein
MGLGSTIGKILKGAKGEGGLLRKMAQDEEKSAVYQHLLPYELSGKAKFGIAATAVGVTTMGSVFDSRKLASLGGEVKAGSARLSGMTDSVQLSKGIKRMQKGKYVGEDSSLTSDGVSGEIVFAMHNMR